MDVFVGARGLLTARTRDENFLRGRGPRRGVPVLCLSVCLSVCKQGPSISIHSDEKSSRFPGIGDCFVANGSPFRRARANEKRIVLCCSRSVNRFFYELRRVGFRARMIKRCKWELAACLEK